MTRFTPLLPTLCLVCCMAASPVSAEGFGDFRAMWVSRYEYSMTSPSSVQQIMSNAASLGMTDVLFQVRGKGDAYYDSGFEPRAERLNGSWDPLQTAVDAAHANGIRLHAWLNSMPVWRDTAGPTDPSHSFYNDDPSFRRVDINGAVENPLAPNGEYASANPILPEFQQHLNNVVGDIASQYEVDGIHLDYIRWIGSQSFSTLPHDAQSHTMFSQATGLDASNPANASAYRGYIKDRITDLVAGVKATVDGVEGSSNRQIDLSAAVWRDPDIAENERLQDYRTWLEQDLLDIAMPMIYLSSSNSNLLAPNLLNTLSIPTNARVAPGLGVYLHDADGGGVDQTISQLTKLNSLGADGATFFSYSSFFGADPLASQRRQALTDFYANLPESVDAGGVLAPEANVLTDFESDEGYFGYSATYSGSNSGVASATAERLDADSHQGGYSQVITIDGSDSGWFLRHVSGIGEAASPEGNTPLLAEGSIGFWLKTTTPGVSVQLAVDDPDTADRGLSKAVVADGQWRLYEWDLSDDTQWEGWVSGDGKITGPTVTFDSIQFSGLGDAVIHLDSIAHNPLGSLLAPPVPGDYDRNGVVDAGDYLAWRSQYGADVAPGDGADGNQNGRVDAADYSLWRDALTPASAETGATPEPIASMLIGVGSMVFTVVGQRRPRRVAACS